MTLIAFATYGADRIEFITDSASYTRRVSHMGRCTKFLTIAHLDAAVLTQGDSGFGDAAQLALWRASAGAATLDELVDHTPAMLQSLHTALIDDGTTPADDESVIFALGWSDREQRFRAWGFASDDGFEPFIIPGLWVMPSPWAIRPSKLEHKRMQRWMAGHPDVDEAARQWWAKPQERAPRSPQEWIELAVAARQQRSLSGGFAHVIVAGDVFHTRLKRGSIETRKVHTFNDTGAEFLEMVSGTEHPVALASACPCGSGSTYGDCHAAEAPCGCRSGRPFSECCRTSDSVDAADSAPARS